MTLTTILAIFCFGVALYGLLLSVAGHRGWKHPR